MEISRLKPYVKFADAANSGRKLFVLTHSSVPSQGRASTTETAHYLAYKTSSPVHGQSPRQSDPYGLQLYESVDSGSFIMRGYRGGDIPAHCAQLTLMNQVLGEQIQSRWLKTSPATPSVSAASSEKSTATDAKNTAKSGSSQKNSSASATAKSRK